jgi:citrate lyase subunit beta / citryl-CoA lyase
MPHPARLRRSELSTPASSEKMIAKAAASQADLVFLDLEDAVAPSAKESARGNIVAGLTGLDWGSKVRAFRINSVETPWCHGDLIDVVSGAGDCIDVIIVPKVKSPRHVWFVDDLLTQLETKLGLQVGRIGLELLIEEAEALACVEEIAASSPRLEALILGVGDLSGSLGMRAGHIGVTDATGESLRYPGDMWHYARNRMIVSARANGLDPIDGPYGDFTNPDGYRRESATFATLGGVGKWCIHPSQIELANEVFAPTPEEIQRARAVVEAVEEADRAGLGAARLGGVMIDIASTRMFRTVLDRAELCGLT